MAHQRNLKGKGQIVTKVLRRVFPAVMALGVAFGGLTTAGTAYASSHASTKTHHAAAAHASTAAHHAVATGIKAGSSCTKAELDKTHKAGKATFVCKSVGKTFKWETAKPVKSTKKAVAKPVKSTKKAVAKPVKSTKKAVAKAVKSTKK